MTQAEEAKKGGMQKILDVVERVGNKVPHPVVIFLILIAVVIVLSHIFYMMGVAISYQVINPETHKLETTTTAARSLLTADGIRFMFTGVVTNFMNFHAVGVIIVAMVGVGVAEASGLVKALIRKLVIISPSWALTWILVFVGIISSIAADAGYLVLIPLAGAAFISVGRHPLAGLALAFASVASVFLVNILIVPVDGILVGITNDAIHLLDAEQVDRPGIEPLVLDRLGARDDGRRRDRQQPHRRTSTRQVHRRLRSRGRKCTVAGRVSRPEVRRHRSGACARLRRCCCCCRRGLRCATPRPVRSSATRRS